MKNLRRELFGLGSLICLSALVSMCQEAWAQGQQIIFSATGDIPYGTSEVSKLQTQINNHDKYSPSKFIVHVGDILSGSESCNQTRYSDVANILKSSAAPAYIVPGDNETTDCSNATQGFNWWMQYFQNFEINFCGAPYTEHQSVRPQNWAFVMDGVLFIGIDLVGSTGTSSSDQQKDADWVEQQFTAKVSLVRAAAVFAQAGPDSKRNTFFNAFEQSAGTFAKPVLFLHGDGHSWIQDNPWSQPNTMRIEVDNGGAEDPVQITVTTSTSSPSTTFTVKRKPWSNSPSNFNMPPCANAGPDETISGMSTTLQGSATDDLDSGSSLTTTWSTVSGPGTVTFSNANALAPTATFSVNGIYTLRLTASDGQLQKTDDVLIGVNTSLNNLPIISSFTPTSGNTGTVVTISGSNFTDVTGVAFNGTTATSFIINSSTQITATAPAGATTGKIAITNSFGTGVSVDDFVVSTGGGGGGGSLTFHPTDDSYVWSLGPTTNYGSVTNLRVEMNSSTDVSNIYFKFNVSGIGGPVISAKLRLQCTDGSSAGGSIFSVANDYLGTSTPWIEGGLVWDNAPAITGTALSTLGSVSSGQMYDLDVTAAVTGNGVYSFAINNTSSNAAMYSSKENSPIPELIIDAAPAPPGNPPTITSFTPASGLVATAVTITGTHFTGATIVAFNGTPAGFTIDSDTQIQTTVPAGATTGKISVTNADGSGLSATDFTVISLAPVITSFTPSGGLAATAVTITGSKFTGTTAVAFNGAAAVFTVNSDTEIQTTVPATATTGKLSVTNAHGIGLSATDFSVISPPTIIAFTPNLGPEGTQVTIIGSNFTGTIGVTINGNVATAIIVDSDAQVRATVPIGATLGTGKIVVTNAAGSATSADDFTITLAPLSFTFAPLHDAYVKLSSPTGNNGTASTLRLQKSSSETYNTYLKFEVAGLTGTLSSAKFRLYVSDGGTDGGSLYLVSNNYLNSTTPWIENGLIWNNAPAIAGTALSSLGAVTIDQWVELDVTAAIIGNGTYSFGLKNNVSDQVYYRSKENGTATAPQLVILVIPSNAPSLTSFMPGDGPVNAEVTINGNNFTGATAVTFNGVAATAFTVDSNIKIRAKVPAGATSGKIRVINAEGSGSYAADFIVTATPAIASFTPGTGPEKTEVTITGSNFTGVTNVQFNGSAATLLYVDSETQIRATVPTGATPGVGKIMVTNSAGSATSVGDFIIMPPPIILTPAHDVYVSSSAPTTNYGTSSTVRAKVGSSETFISYLKFGVAGMSGAPVSAKLRLYVTNSSPDGGAVYLVSNDYLGVASPWLESGMLWANAPAITGTPLSAIGTATSSQWVEFDVTAAIIGNGTYSFAIKNNNSDAVYYASKEATNDPQLVIQMPLGASAASKRATDEAMVAAIFPAEFTLGRNYPNPFNPSTQIRFGLPQSSHVTIKVYTINGAEVRTLVDRDFEAGNHDVTFHAKALPSGTYFYVMQAGAVRKVRRLMLVK